MTAESQKELGPAVDSGSELSYKLLEPRGGGVKVTQ